MNDQLQKLQGKLYDWIFHRKVPLSYNTIQLAAKGLLKQYHPEMEEEKAWRYLFFPLLRSGVVLFCGQGKYALSPTVQLLGKENSLLVNTFDYQATSNDLVEQPGPGQILLLGKCMQDAVEDIPVAQFNLTRLLRQIPTLQQIVTTSFFECENAQRYHHKKQGSSWIDYSATEQPTAGIYRYGEHVFSPKYLVLQKKHYDIPGLNENPDAYTLANLVDQINQQRKLSNIIYHTQSQRLSITNPFFPIELEKLLYLNTVLARFPIAKNIERRSYYLSFSAYQQLNRIFHQKIILR